jgi:hypothetical protein
MLSTYIVLEHQTYHVIVETNEKRQTISFFMYSPFRGHPSRFRDLAIIFNRINYAQ